MEFNFLYALNKTHNPILDAVMIVFTYAGSYGVLWIVIAVFMLFFKKTKKCGMTVLLSLIISLIVCNVLLKNVVKRSRPCWIDTNIVLLLPVPKDYSFPSGHAFSSFAAAASISNFDKKFGKIAFLTAGIISFSRLYIFVHFPTDVLAGAVFGFLSGKAACKVIKYIEK